MSGSDSLSAEQIKLTPEIVLRAYAAGIFPMAESYDDPDIFWVDPDVRGILPLDNLHISRSLRKKIRQKKFEVRCNTEFDAVIQTCAEFNEDRHETWINSEIIRLYRKLFYKGHVHTIECWREDKLVGGLYGVALKGAFFGESMFSREADASKVALVHLAARLKHADFVLLDTQFVTEHLLSLGAVEVPRNEYHLLLDKALDTDVRFPVHLAEPEADNVLSNYLNK